MKTVLFFLMAGTLAAVCRPAGAQEKKPVPPKTTAPTADVKFAYGTVAKVETGRITVSEYDYEKDEELSVVYEVDPQAALKNVDSLQAVTAGQTVEISFVVKNNKRVAMQITVEEEDGADEADSADGAYDEELLLDQEQ